MKASDRKEPTLKYDVVGAIIDYEQGELGHDASIELFQYLYDTGTIRGLQGSYQRTLQQLIQAGIVKQKKEVA